MPYIPPYNDSEYILDQDETESVADITADVENTADYKSYEYTGPDDIGVPDAIPSETPETQEELAPTGDESTEPYYKVYYRVRVPLDNYEPAYLQELANNGATFYAIYDDDTEEVVDWDDITPLDPEGELVDFSDAIASATNQHFWDDINGAHVGEMTHEDWDAAVTNNFSDLSASKNYYNILLNSLGVLLRRALYTLVSISRGGISFYDGLGNETTNIMSYFGRDSAQIGRDNGKHLVINNNGITVYNGDGTVAPLNASNINAVQATINELIAGSVTTETLRAASAYIAALSAANVSASDISADKATINSLVSGSVTTTTLRAASAYIAALEAASVSASDISADKATLNELVAGNVTTTTLRAASAYIAALEAASVSASDISADKATLNELVAGDVTTTTLRAASAYIAALSAASVSASDLSADHATIGALDTNYAQVNLANVDNAWIENGTVKDGAITNAMINSVSANKLTAGRIDASNITVTNLNADNITAGTLNGERIGNGTLSLSKLEDDVYTETEVDSIVNNLQTQIDGAIETWTGTDIPTLQNTPAVNWNTNSIKDTHVGDVYFVVNSQSQQNGYNYRFTKIDNTYSWQLIKDNDVTNALQRLTNAEGRIGTIETFDTTVSSFMTNTDNELSSIKSAATTLAGRVDTAEGTLATKVDTTTFNTLSQTVEGNSSSIQQLTTSTTVLTGRVDDIDADIKVFNKQKETIITDTNVRSEPPIDLTVFGFSRQITTTGKNLLDYADASWGTFRTSSSSGGTIVASGGSSRRYFAVPLAAGQSVTWHRNGLIKFSGYLKLCTSYPPVVGDTISGGATITNNANYTLTNNSGEDACAILFISSKPTVANLEIMQAQLEYGSTFTSYEYCSGGIPSPSQTWPREIRVVDQLTLHFRSKNLIDISDMERGGTSGGVNSSSTIRIRLKESKKIPVIPGVEYGIGGTVTNGSCGCYIYWNDVRGYWSSNNGWLESGSIVECPEGVYNARILFRREDDTTVTLEDFSDLWFGPIVEYEEPIDSVVSIDLQGHELRSVYDIAEDRLIFEKQTGSTYSLSLVQETGVTTSATSDGLDVIVGQNALSTTGDLSDGATVIYCLPEPIVYDLGTITLPNLSSPNIYVYGETERYTYTSSYGVEIPYLEMSYWAMSIRNLVAQTIEKQITTSAKVNDVSDTVAEHTRKIGSLETTVETKADGSTVETISNNLSTLQQDVNGFRTTVSETYATKTEIKTTNEADGSVIRVDDAMAAPAISLVVRGKSEQITTTGKNLLDPTLMLDQAPWNVIPIYAPEGTVLTMSTNHITESISSGGELPAYFRQPSGSQSSSNIVNEAHKVTQTVGELGYVEIVQRRVSGEDSFANYEWQIELGSDATAYEPYTGGESSPCPDWPQDVASVDELVIHANNTLGVTWWNQVVRVTNRTVTSKGVTYTAQNGKITLSGTATGTETFQTYGNYQYTYVSGHKYLIKGGSSANKVSVGSHQATEIFQVAVGFMAPINIFVAEDFDGTYECYPQLFDLTLMFGAGNEPSTVAEFETIFPEPYYLYDSGSWLDFGNWPVSDLLPEGTSLRSLPDGTKDELHLSYLRPSTREGWAWYSRELVERTVERQVTSFTRIYTDTDTRQGLIGTPRFYKAGLAYTGKVVSNRFRYNYAAYNYGGPGTFNGDDAYVFEPSTFADLAAANEWLAENPITVVNIRDNPITTQLDPIELPILHSPTCTVYATADATPGLHMKYWTLAAEGIVDPILVSDSSYEGELSAITTRVSTAESNITQNANNITTKVSKDGVISSINQSAETIKIQASKVEIDGTAIFNNSDFKNAADGAYASKSSESLIETANTNANTALQTALDGAFLVLTSTNGQLFKNGSESTILQVAIFPNGGSRCDTIAQVRNRFGSTAYIEWKWMHDSDGEWGTLLSNDTHLSQGGMWLTVSPEDVATKTTFSASLVVPD